MKPIRVLSAFLTIAQIGWAAAIIALGTATPLWALVTGAVLAAVGTAAPGILEKAVA
jgi:hypothetical protein